MVKYDTEHDEMVFDNPKGNIMVVDADCQALMNLSTVGDRFRVEFPVSFKAYEKECLIGGRLGGMLLCEERGFKIAIIFTTLNRIGMLKDEPDTIKKFTYQALDALAKKFPNAKFSSGILNRHTALWGYTSAYLNGLKLDWTIHRN